MSHLMRSPYPVVSGSVPTVIGGNAQFYAFPTLSKSMTLPSGWQAGDLLCLYVITVGQNSTISANHTISTSGWTTASSQFRATQNVGIYTYYKTASSGETNPTVTFNNSGGAAYYSRVILVVYRGATALSTPYSALSYDGSSPFEVPSRSVSAARLLVGVVAGFRSNAFSAPGAPSISPAPLSGATYDTSVAGSGWVFHAAAASSGTYGPWSVTYANGGSWQVCNLLEISS